jgi:hypothetical protein
VAHLQKIGDVGHRSGAAAVPTDSGEGQWRGGGETDLGASWRGGEASWGGREDRKLTRRSVHGPDSSGEAPQQRRGMGSGAAYSQSGEHQGDSGVFEEVAAELEVAGDVLSACRCSHSQRTMGYNRRW